MMKILCIIPPYVPSYFNAGHHLPVFSVANYLRKHYPKYNIDAFDFGILNFTWKELCNILIKQYDIIYTMFDYDTADTCERFAYYVNQLSPSSYLVAFGRLVKEIPFFFTKRGYVAIAKGDFECGAEQYLRLILKIKEKNTCLSYVNFDLDGIVTNNTTQESYQKMKGNLLEPDEWVLPDVEEIPYDTYEKLYQNDLNKFCGIPNRRELVVPIARGCPVGCYFCDVHRMQGLKERRLSVDKTLDYIQKSFSKIPFEYFTFYAPTFTLNPKWVLDFCTKKISLNINYPWKCVTVLKTLTSELLIEMTKANCVRISFGIETFDDNASLKLPRIKRNILEHFKKICKIAQETSLEINVFLILGLPGDNIDSIEHTVKVCLENGIRVRPTIYTDYSKLNNNMTITDIGMFNRQIILPLENNMSFSERKRLYDLFYDNHFDKSTNIMNKIELRR